MSQTEQQEIENTNPPPAPAQKDATKARLIGFSVLAIVAVGGYFLYHYLETNASRYVKTDNAYAAAELAQITPKIAGTITELNVIDTQYVHQGDLIAKLGDSDQKLAILEAEAQLQMAQRKITGQMASDKQFAAQIAARDADIKSASEHIIAANIDLAKTKIDLQRRQNLIGAGAVSGDELTNAKHAYDTSRYNLALAQAALEQAKANKMAAIGTRTSNAASFANSTLSDNPEVLLAKTRLQQARNNQDDTNIYAPISGVIARRQVQIGQKVQAGASLMEIVPVDQIHIDANFKEVQLRDVRLGQKVEVTSDLYGEKVVYHGTVAGFSGGTGSAFSLIPAQNASGNWIKVVQRLPVRINIDPKDLAKNPLKVGLSMKVTIDTWSDKNNSNAAKGK